MPWKKIFLFTLVIWLIFSLSKIQAQEKKNLIPLLIKNTKIFVELARTEKEKARGLMFRTKLAENEGMLFIYEQEEILAFWMKNTFLPLSIAFIDRHGRIIDIQDMEPFSLDTHRSARPAQYALEVNKGWFEKNGIKVGDVVKMPGWLRK
ncbi:MAG: DUF192 domain-containing protein [Thermodesulfobacteriota bacterium]